MRFRSILLALLGGNLLLTGANLLRDVALASAFGATRESDILFLALGIPLFLVSVGANAFRSVSVPALSQARTIGVDACRALTRRFLQIANSTTIIVSALLALVALALYFVPLPLVDHPARMLFAKILAAIIPMYLCAALLESWQGPYQAWNRFLGPSLLRLGLPLGIAIGALALPGLSIFSTALGGGAGALAGLAAGILLFHQLGIAPGRGGPPLPTDVGHTARANFLSLALATCITYANPLVDQWLAGLTGAGGISQLGYANRLTTGIVTLGSTALAQSLLVHYSRLVGTGDRHGIGITYRQLLGVMPWLGCLATITVWLTSDFAIALLYERGSFTTETTARVATLTDLYALQLPIYWTAVASFTLIWAVSMNQVFLRIGILLFFVNVVTDLILIQAFGLDGIPLTTSVVYGLSGLLLYRALRNAGWVTVTLRDLMPPVAALLYLAASWLVIRYFDLQIYPGASVGVIASGLGLIGGNALLGGLAAVRAFRMGTARA